MIIRQTNILLFVLALSLISSCKEDDINDTPQTHFTINESLKDWMSPFNEINKEFTYKNDLNDETTVKVIHRNFPSEESFADCQRNDGTYQCEYESMTLEFSTDTLMYLTAWLIGEDRLTLNYSSDGGLSPEIVRYRDNDQEFENPQPDNFEVEFVSEYSYANSTKNAIIVNTISLDGLFASQPPNSFVFVRGVGVVEWNDYSGNVWVLEN